MGTITARKRSNGTTGYTAQVRLTVAGKPYTEAQTFDRQALAKEWLRRREAEIDQKRASGEMIGHKQTLGELIDWYVREIAPDAKWGRTKAADLLRIRASVIAKLRATDITTADYIRHAEARKAEGAGPATVGNDFVWIGQVLRSARPSLGVLTDLARLDDARHELRSRKAISKSRHRSRRISADEEARLIDYFTRGQSRGTIPMADIFQFAILSARRQEEITRIEWSDLNEAKGIAKLRDVKHPTRKQGNDKEFRMLSDAWAIVKRQPRTDAHVFPYESKSIGAAFARACKFLGIEDLRWHDTRHEATSRLFEKGYQIQEVAQFTLHESWATLKRYTNLKAENVVER